MIERMLSDPSEKLKAFARGTLILEIIGSVGGGIAVWAWIGDLISGLLAFLGTVIGGILVAWFTALLIEGFACIVASSENKEASYATPQPQGSAFRNVVVKQTQSPVSTPAAGVNYDGSWNCTCGRKNSSYVSTCTCGTNKREIVMGDSK